MARGFTDVERERLRAKLKSTGRRLFIRYGLKKTTIRELTEPLGIAKSSFYLFFDSKEALYWQLLLDEGAAVEVQIRAAVEGAGEDTRAAIESLLRTTVRAIETNDLYRRLLDHRQEMKMVTEWLPPESAQAKAEGSLELIVGYVRQWQTEDGIVEGRPEGIASALRAVTLLTLHKDDIGSARYADVMDLIIRVVAEGLTRPAPT